MTSYSEFHEKIVDVKGKHPHFVAQIERTNPTYEDDFITWGGHAEGTGKVERRDEENLDELIRLLEDTFGKRLWKKHYQERVPHQHTSDRRTLKLTTEIRVEDFVHWLINDFDTYLTRVER